MPTLNVDLGERSYPIYIESGILDDGDRLRRHLVGREVLIVSNDTVAPLYLQRLRQSLGNPGLVSEVVLPDGEQHKTLAVLEQIFDRALADRHGRNTTLVALGGGVVGDMAGFAAACYQRGVAFIQVPTTLLAQVDSSVGGKTAVNHPLGKNMIGAFHQPRAVFIDPDVLATLEAREYAAGLAEVIKYGLICDAGFYRWLLDERAALRARDTAALAEAIERSCAAKARVVALDEREAGQRAILNLGHTFGHAIEAAQGYGEWLHGEAVAVGMLLALRLSARRGWLSQKQVAELAEWLAFQGLPTVPPAMDVALWLDHMYRDKKVLDGRLRLILLRAVGEACIVDDANRDELTELLTMPVSA
ncbi:MAG: 3-dehydroquinate synthase [Halieaceae bacterium]|nr:3-dehydroquinate synthase [Halieaceae bacterium]